ncbi:hypothetical protein CR513_53285, partial [Mucuna pruriens]
MILLSTVKRYTRGVWGIHISGRALASKIARVEYYWPTLKKDWTIFVKRCDKYQRFADLNKAPLELLYSIMSPWPFHMWGVDILSPFLLAVGQVKFLIVFIDYFTKWVEVEPVVTISTKRIRRFYWKEIICHFGLPTIIVSDNNTQFILLPQLNTRRRIAKLSRQIRRRLKEAKGRLAEELSWVLSSHHTTPHSRTQETPFRLTFGTNAVISIDIGESSPRATFFQPA